MRDWTTEERRYLTWKAQQRLLADHGGWNGLALWLYAGRVKNEQGMTLHAPSLAVVIPIVVAESQQWHDQRSTHHQRPTEGETNG